MPGKTNRKKYTEEELELITKCFAKTGSLICKKMGLTPFQVWHKAVIGLGLKCSEETSRIIRALHVYKNDSNELVDKFITISDPKIAYFLGFFWADGCNNKKRELTIKIADSDFEEVNAAIKDVLPWKYSKITTKIGWKDKKSFYYVSRRLSNLFNYWGIVVGRTDIKPLLNRIPSNMFPFFLLGLIDGDGCWFYRQGKNTRNKALTITGPANFDWSSLEERIRLEINPNITSRVYICTYKTGSHSTLTFNSALSVKAIGAYVYQFKSTLEQFGLSRKYQKWLFINQEF